MLQLDNIVVTAAGFEQDIRDAPASISIITGEDLRKQPFNNLNDAIKHVEGLSIVGSDAAGTDISIRGMPADYTVIMVDGKRRSSRETRTRGGTSGIGRAERLFILALFDHIEDPPAFAWQALKTVDAQLVHDGRTLEGDVANLAELRTQYTTFLAQRLPLLQALGIL